MAHAQAPHPRKPCGCANSGRRSCADRDALDHTGEVSTWVRRIVDGSGEVDDQPTRYVPSRHATVGAVMTRTTYCVRPDVAAARVAALLLEHRLGGMPVVDAAGRPIGVISKTDLLRHAHDGDAALVGDIMMPMAVVLGQDVPIAQAAALMAGEGIHRLPIVDDTGAVCGILSALDVVRWVAEEAGYRV